VIFTLGILSLFTIPFVLGPIAWVLGNGDLKLMRAGRMDPEGLDMTSTGRLLGMIATILSAAGLAVFCLLWVAFCGGLGSLFYRPVFHY
jgi:hypothetical protein